MIKSTPERCITAAMLLACSIVFAQNNQQDERAILTVLANQQQAWNSGELDQFMEGYWKSDSLKFIGGSGVTRGWTTTLENYRKRYPSPEAMGHLTFTLLSLEFLSPTSAYMVGKWELKRLKDNPGGYFTLLWKKINGKWVIVADHTS